MRVVVKLFVCSLILFNFSYGVSAQEEQSALSIDEKLTLRVLRTSDSKKTILTNRGLEDGLVVDTHAKFFLTEGVVARGVVVKASPSRSVWSIYRIVDSSALTSNTVMNIKISSALKLTEDPTQSISVSPQGPNGQITERVMAPMSEDSSRLTDSDREELEDFELSGNSSLGSSSLSTPYSQRKWEAFGLIYMNSLSGTSESSNADSTEVSQSNIAFSLGIERYFYDSESFLKNFSIFGFFHSRSGSAGDELIIESSWTEFGGGANYHFYGQATRPDNLVGFLSASFGIGSVSASTTSSTNQDDQSLEGSNNFLSLGVGGKYGLSSGWGARALLDYYSSGESFSLEGGDEITRSLSGPRIQLGVSYRF